MANEVMAKAITGIDDELIVNAYTASRKKRNLKPLYSIGALAACLVLIFTVIFGTSSKGTDIYLNSDKITSDPVAVTSPLSLASNSPRATTQPISIHFELDLKGETEITCSQGTFKICGINQDTLFYTGSNYLVEKDVAKKPLSLEWTVNNPDEATTYTLTFEGKETQILNLKFDENQNNWTVFIEK